MMPTGFVLYNTLWFTFYTEQMELVHLMHHTYCIGIQKIVKKEQRKFQNKQPY